MKHILMNEKITVYNGWSAKRKGREEKGKEEKEKERKEGLLDLKKGIICLW